jgi:ubiquinone/menaquinone biosynthesis C-methylase UbiE
MSDALPRHPEPELMNDPAQAQAYAAADFAEAHDAFVAAFATAHPLFTGTGRVLDLGCGPCDVVARFLARYPACRVDAVDGAQEMLRLAALRLTTDGARDRVNLIQGCLPAWSPPAGTYTAVTSNSLLHHLADPLDLWRALRLALAPGGVFLVMDLARPTDRACLEALVERYAAEAPPVLRRDFAASLEAAYRPDEVAAQCRAVGLALASLDYASDRHWVASGLMHQ